MTDEAQVQHRLAQQVLSRRKLLAAGTGLGAAGLAAGMAPGIVGAAPAGASTPATKSAPAGPGPFGTSALAAGAGPITNIVSPTPVPGATIRTVTADTFMPVALSSGSSLVGVLSPAGSYNSAGAALFAPLDVPTGATLKQVDCYAFGVGSSTGGNWFLIKNDNAGSFATVVSTPATAGPGLVVKTFSGLSVTVGPGDQVLADLTSTTANYYAVAVSYQYIPATPGFHPIAPVRVYDSRFNAPLGVLAAGGNRLISVANAYTPATNVVSIIDVVPAGAVAVAYNLTVTNTSAAGFVQLAPGSATTVTGSSINWAAGQTIANGGVVSLDSSRRVKAFAVASSTDVIIDVEGYYL